MIPMSVWDNEMPITERVICEAICRVNNVTTLCCTLADGLQIGDKTIYKGTFMAYSLGGVHLIKKFYPEPLKLYPGRFDIVTENETQWNAPFLGWGTGQHPCTGQFLHCSCPVIYDVGSGMKVVKFEIKMILAPVLS